jgi:hypothetical protein
MSLDKRSLVLILIKSKMKFKHKLRKIPKLKMPRVQPQL